MKTTKDYIKQLNHWCGLTRGWKYTGKEKPKNSVDLDINDIQSKPEAIPMEIFTAINAVTAELSNRIRREEDIMAALKIENERLRKEEDLAREVRENS